MWSYFNGLIRELASSFDAPIFQPHLTAHVATAAREDPKALLHKIVATREPYRLTTQGLKYLDEFTKTLFVQFAPDLKLARLSKDLRRASASRSDYELNPHLSLLYKKVNKERKRAVAASIKLPFRDVIFDRAQAVISAAEVRTRQDVEAWQVVAERNLAE